MSHAVDNDLPESKIDKDLPDHANKPFNGGKFNSKKHKDNKKDMEKSLSKAKGHHGKKTEEWDKAHPKGVMDKVKDFFKKK